MRCAGGAKGENEMANEEEKDFNAMLHRDAEVPRPQIVTDPVTAGIFVSIAAWASFQRRWDKTPYWRTLQARGELNPKYPGGVEAQRACLEAEGHTVLRRGRTNLRYFVKDHERAPFSLEEGGG